MTQTPMRKHLPIGKFPNQGFVIVGYVCAQYIGDADEKTIGCSESPRMIVRSGQAMGAGAQIGVADRFCSTHRKLSTAVKQSS